MSYPACPLKPQALPMMAGKITAIEDDMQDFAKVVHDEFLPVTRDALERLVVGP
jgi:hypothetical protein